MRKVEAENKGRAQPASGWEEMPAPADEYEALRMQLLAELRRQPGETKALMRKLVSLSRLEASQGRVSARKRERLAANLEVILSRFGDLIVPPDR